jgi:hypothetical protein
MAQSRAHVLGDFDRSISRACVDDDQLIAETLGTPKGILQKGLFIFDHHGQ